MEFKHIQYFIKTAQYDSISQAANELFVSQQALSKSLQLLEKELNTQLFYRTRKGIHLTDDGKYVHGKYKHICELFEEATKETYEHYHIYNGKLEFCVALGVFRSIPVSYQIDFEKMYPQIFLEQLETVDLECEEYVRRTPLHFSLSTRPWYTNGLHFIPLHREPIYFISSKSHPLAHKEKIFLKDLVDESFLFFTKQYNIHYRTLNACKAAGFIPNIVYKSADVSQLVKLASQNLGIFLCVKHVYDEANNENLVCIPVEDENLWWELGFIFQDFQSLSKHAKLFINYFIGRIHNTTVSS